MVREAVSTLFPHLPDDARVWIFGASRHLQPEEETRLFEEVDTFLQRWKAHGHPLAASRAWLDDRFLMIAVDDRVATPSGCSIDALVRDLRRLESELGVELVGGAPVWYRGADGSPCRVSRPGFKEAVARGEVTRETIVFDLSLTRVGEVRAGKWERPAEESWHRRYLA